MGQEDNVKVIYKAVLYWGLLNDSIAGDISVPIFLVLPLRCVVHGEFKGLALATQHGATVPDTGHHQLKAVPQQRHRGRGPCIYPGSYRDMKWNIGGGTCHEKKKVLNRVLFPHSASHAHTHPSHNMNTWADTHEGEGEWQGTTGYPQTRQSHMQIAHT